MQQSANVNNFLLLLDPMEITWSNQLTYLSCTGSPEHFRMDGRLQDEDDDEERKQQEAAQREQSHLENLPAVGADGGNTGRENVRFSGVPQGSNLGQTSC